MSTIEDRLARDIAAFTGGVVVTESDLNEARGELDERIAGRKKRNRSRTVAALVAAAVVIPIVGVAVAHSLSEDETTPSPVAPVSPDTPGQDLWLTGGPPTQDLVQGLWRQDNGPVSIRFSSPDVVSVDDQGRVFGSPAVVGTYRLAGDVITVHVDGGTAGCHGDTFTMRVSIPEPGLMRYVPTVPGSFSCSLVTNEWGAWEKILPAGPSFSDFVFSDKESWKPWPGVRTLYGMWAAERGGYVLEIDRDGSYYVADGSGEPIDRGRWSYGQSRLTLTSSGDSVECSRGDRAVLVDLEHTNPGTDGMQWTVEDNTCGGAWAGKAWFLVPDTRR